MSRNSEASTREEILMMGHSIFSSKNQRSNLSSIPGILCIYFLATYVVCHPWRVWALCVCRLLQLTLDIFHLHMTASCQSLISHLHTVASCSSFYLWHGCRITVISPSSRSSLLISTWLPHAHGFPSPHSCPAFIPSYLHCMLYVNGFSFPCRCCMLITSHVRMAATVPGIFLFHNSKYP